MNRRTLILSAAAMAALTACTSTWETAYTGLSAAQTKNWRIARVDVNVPSTLTVSEENVYLPDADIVWHGDPDGNRYEQVAQIFRDAAKIGTRSNRGGKSVTMTITVRQFHALSPIARKNLQSSGVHDIRFDIAITDRAGTVLASEENIRADLAAYTGKRAIEAEKIGQTQRVRITNHLAAVLENWLGGANDPRHTFSRIGR